MSTTEKETPVTATADAPKKAEVKEKKVAERKPYKLKKPIIQAGKEIPAEETVNLTADQYKRLSASGHV